MDLLAYIQTDGLSSILKENNITDIPRLRGLRVMTVEEPIPNNELTELLAASYETVYRDFITSVPFGHPTAGLYCSNKEKEDKYLIKEKITETIGDATYETDRVIGIDWSKIHGKARKRLKLALKHKRKTVLKNIELYNKYAGRNDVMYIHARLGSMGWGADEMTDIRKKGWYLDDADDIFDASYCDIYAKIKPLTTEEIETVKNEN